MRTVPLHAASAALVVALVLVETFPAHAATWIRSGVRYGIGVSASASYTSPHRLFAESYEPALGSVFSVTAGSWGEDTTGVNMAAKVRLYFATDRVDLKHSAAERFDLGDDVAASISSLHFGVARGPIVCSSKNLRLALLAGGSIGGSRFSIDDNSFAALGRSTLTELKGDNHKTNLSTNKQFCLELFAMRRVSFQYSYNFMEIDGTSKLLHSLVSSTINELLVDGVPVFIRRTFPENAKNSMAAYLGEFAYKLGGTILWDRYTYKKGNWPFHDDPSMRYHRQMIGLTYYF